MTKILSGKGAGSLTGATGSLCDRERKEGKGPGGENGDLDG